MGRGELVSVGESLGGFQDPPFSGESLTPALTLLLQPHPRELFSSGSSD